MDAASRVALEISRDANAVVVRVTGEVDMANAPSLSRAARELLRDPPAVLVFDLTGVDVFGSAGVRALFGAVEEAGQATSVRIAAGGRLTRVFQITGLDQAIPVLPDVRGALEH